MLTDEEKKKLTEEEFFRYEVRKSFEKKKHGPIGNSVWLFLNSSFGLWICSTVLVGVLLHYYGNWEKQRTLEATKINLERKLQLEVTNRFQNFGYAMLSLRRSDTVEVDKIKYILNDLVNSNEDYVFPEFRERSLRSLLFEFEDLKKGNDELREYPFDSTTYVTLTKIRGSLSFLPQKEDIQRELKSYSWLQNLSSEKMEEETNKRFVHRIQVIANDCLEHLNNDYWVSKWIGTKYVTLAFEV